MEKKKLQRIIGISVVVALVIVLIPFLFGKRELSHQETAKVVMPLTTNDANQTAVVENANTPSTDNMNVQNAEDNGITPITPTNAPVATNDQSNAPVAAVSPSVDATNPSAASPESMNAAAPSTNAVGETTATTNQPVNPSNPQSPTAAATPVPTPTPNVSPVPVADTTSPTDDNNTVEMTPAVVTDTNTTAHPQATAEQVATEQHVTREVVKPKHLHKNAIAKKANHISNVTTMKRTAWVVQMGSFKNQSNAHRLVNQLKGSGFKAFARVVTSPAGAVRTRVYIGPEVKEASAKKLSAKVAQAVKLQGIVVAL